MITEKFRKKLESLYFRYNKREFVHPDPLEFLYLYKDISDREIVGLIASSLAYGRVAQILKNVSWVLSQMGKSPRLFVEKSNKESLQRIYLGFRHRFTTGDEVVNLIIGIKNAIEKYGSLHKTFSIGIQGYNIRVPMCAFTQYILPDRNFNSLLPKPEKDSACKRLNLYLRWMVRNDDVDPGGWEGIPLSMLVVPLDTHMHKISKRLGLTNRNQANLKTATEITEGFAQLCPDDPVKYDFALTRLGIRTDTDLEGFMKELSE